MSEPHAVEELDGEIEGAGTAVEPVAPSAPAVAPSITPMVTADELGARLKVIEETMDNEMVEGTDYGKVPGTDKPTLLKPGAEKLSVLFRLDVQPRSSKTWGPGEHLTVETFATVYSMETGARMGAGEGLCTTREKKYGKRTRDRECPICGAASIKRSKFPPRDNPNAEPGWYCYEKVGGCGANFEAADPEIATQTVGEIENPHLPDMWNTVIKMAEKRARVNAVLAVTGASAIFTQDLEENIEGETKATAAGMPVASDAERKLLNEALNWLLPDAEGEKVWGEIKGMFAGELYGPVCRAVAAPISARKVLDEG